MSYSIVCTCGKAVFSAAITVHYLNSSSHPKCEHCNLGFQNQSLLEAHQDSAHRKSLKLIPPRKADVDGLHRSAAQRSQRMPTPPPVVPGPERLEQPSEQLRHDSSVPAVRTPTEVSRSLPDAHRPTSRTVSPVLSPAQHSEPLPQPSGTPRLSSPTAPSPSNSSSFGGKTDGRTRYANMLMDSPAPAPHSPANSVSRVPTPRISTPSSSPVQSDRSEVFGITRGWKPAPHQKAPGQRTPTMREYSAPRVPTPSCSPVQSHRSEVFSMVEGWKPAPRQQAPSQRTPTLREDSVPRVPTPSCPVQSHRSEVFSMTGGWKPAPRRQAPSQRTPTPREEPAVDARHVSYIFCRACRRDPCEIATLSLCGHIFCRRCIVDAALHTGTCPACRAPVALSTVFRLHVL